MYKIVTIEYGGRDNLPGVFGEWIEKNFKVTSLKMEEVGKPNA
jgi:hypothetical protein